MSLSHVLLDQQGVIVEADESFATLLLTTAVHLRGRSVLSVTALADRGECSKGFAELRTTGKPYDITKRLIRDDASLLWVHASAAWSQDGQQGMISVACSLAPEPIVRRTPEGLLRSAKLQAAMIEERSSICDPMLLLGASWPVLLQVYIAEAEGRVIDLEVLAACLGQTRRFVERLVIVLTGLGLVEAEEPCRQPDPAVAYRLTIAGMERLEDYLLKFAPPVPL